MMEKKRGRKECWGGREEKEGRRKTEMADLILGGNQTFDFSQTYLERERERERERDFFKHH